MFKKQFVCVWGTGYCDTPKSEIHEHTWFLEGRGYDADMYDNIMDLDITEVLNLSDLSGYHVILRIGDIECAPDDRTQALFTAWRGGKYYDNDKHKILYPDQTMISMSEPTYTVLVGNREIQLDDLDAAERWLWNNFVAGERDAGQV